MSSKTSPLEIRSQPDVRITVYDQAGRQRLAGLASVAAALPRGRYHVHLDRCDFVTKKEIKHPARREHDLVVPEVESPAPIKIARDSAHHASVAHKLSATGGRGVLPLGDGDRTARLFVFVRRIGRGAPGAVLPSEPVSIHDVVGRWLVTLSPDNADHSDDPSTGYLALSCQVPSGTYRLRVGRGRRDLAITIPAGRAAQVFLADRGTVSLRTARIYLPRIGEPFDAASKTARAMESVLWALGRPRGELPEIARDLLRDATPDLTAEIERDPVFGIACAHLARRHGRDPLFDSLMAALNQHAPELPDVMILERLRGAPRPSPAQPDLALPPLFRASIVLALAERVPAAVPGVFTQVAIARHDDSVWCTWSPRWWDARWVEPTVAQLRRRDDAPVSSAADIASVLRIPEPVVARALERLDAALPDGTVVTDVPGAIPGCTLQSVLGSGDRSTVFLAHREDIGREVAVKILPVARVDADRIAGQIQATRRVEHPRLVWFERSGKLPDGSAVWLEMERCRESLFDQLAKRGGPLALDEACDLVLHVLEGLEALHAAGIVHGRVHPKNLLVRTDGSVALALLIFTAM